MSTRRWPVIPTLVVALAVAAMFALGAWQLLDRLPRKEAFLAQIAANPARPPVAFPAAPDDRLLFRRSAALCSPPVAVRLAGAGAAGYRAIARCHAGPGAPQVIAQIGTTRDPKAVVTWNGGRVAGLIGHAPDSRSLIGSLFDPTPPAMMLVLGRPVAGLLPNPAPRIDGIPNNHLAYAGQWFFFGFAAIVIYVLATRRRQR